MWNFIFNGLFERWEARQPRKGRSVLRRIVHAVGFEAGLVAMLVPLFAWVLGVDLLTALPDRLMTDVDALIRKRDAVSPTGKMGTGWDIAYAVGFLASDESRYINGVLLPVDGGLSCQVIGSTG